MIRWAKRLFLLLGLCWAALYFYEVWVITAFLNLSYTMGDFIFTAGVGLGPAILASALLATKWPSKAKDQNSN
jgi:hypothetical protein